MSLGKKGSKTAAGAATCRALGSFQKNANFRNPDYLAKFFIGRFLRFIIRFTFLHKILLRIIDWKCPGVYNFHYVRTRYFDENLLRCLQEKIQQVVILGAGFDTRAHRFVDLLGNTKFYEVDHPTTQQQKIKLIRKLTKINQNVTYVPVDFETDELLLKLKENGFNVQLPTLFLWEGVSMYLSKKAINDMLEFIRTQCSKNSTLVFDYIFEDVLLYPTKYYGSEKHLACVRAMGEPYKGGINYESFENYVSSYNFQIKSNLNANELNAHYLKLYTFSSIKNRLPTFCAMACIQS